MSSNAQPSIETLVRSNEKLLKALITLLSLKDDGLLDELKTIFILAARQRSEIGSANPKVWMEINRELKLIDVIVNGEPGSDGEGYPKGLQ